MTSLTVTRHRIQTSHGTYTHALVHSDGEALIFWSTAYQQWRPCESARAKFGSRAQHLADEFNQHWRIA
jgi:hypothetical protein